jgi:N utilization substance protein A
MEIWRRRIIVADEDLDFENEEILTEARKIELILKLVKMFLKKKLIDLGRRAILALRQNLISKFTNTIIQIFTSNLKI